MDPPTVTIARNQTPFQELRDAFLIETGRPTNDLHEQSLEQEGELDLRCVENGSLLRRSRAPWDQFGVLRDSEFHMMHKTFDFHGQIVFVTLRQNGRYHDVMVGPVFFSGWSLVDEK